MTEYERYIEPFIAYFGKKPRYISNDQIAEYFKEQHFEYNPAAVHAFLTCYEKIDAKRYVLRVLKENLSQEIISQYPQPEKYHDFIQNLKVKKYSPRTISAYKSALHSVNNWIYQKYSVTIDKLTPDMALQYFIYRNDVLRSSYSTVRTHRFTVEYYFHQVLKKHIDLSFMNNMRKDHHLPTVLSRDEILKIIKKITNLKHRMMISLLYSSGLRVSEVVNLKVSDVSFDNCTLKIIQGKGRKDRITIFSENLKEGLFEFTEGKKPVEHLFTSDKDNTSKLSIRTVQKVFERALLVSKIQKKVTCHGLRHSFASHLLENGTDIRYIQQLLGHKNISTTTIYTKVSSPALKGIKSPL